HLPAGRATTRGTAGHGQNADARWARQAARLPGSGAMTMSTMQPEVHALTGAYVCDALDPQERAAFEEHLTECATCRQEVAELREVAAALGAAAVAKPPDTLKLIVDASITVTRQLPPVVTPITAASSVRKRNRPAWAGWIVAAALAG